MIHFKPSAFLRGRSQAPQGSLQSQFISPSNSVEKTYGRADHVRMLAHAAKRRLASQYPARTEDAGYWKACAPAALAKAIAIRAEANFARLP